MFFASLLLLLLLLLSTGFALSLLPYHHGEGREEQLDLLLFIEGVLIRAFSYIEGRGLLEDASNHSPNILSLDPVNCGVGWVGLRCL